MTVQGYELITEWKNSQCGQTARATKGGKTFFLKKYQTPVAPINNGTLDAKTFENNQRLFNTFVARRKRINSAIRRISGSGGNIIIPCDEFFDENHFVEAAELVEGAVDDEEISGVLSALTVDVKKLLMQTAAGALSSVHKLGILHSDLKLKNVLLVRNSSGNYVAKLIDFDSSYFMDDKPDEIIGTIDYYAPELGVYSDIEDEDEKKEEEKKLTEKSDIFSLGLIFHYYLSGALPEAASLTERLEKRKAKGKVIYCWLALIGGCELKISPAIKSVTHMALIRDMLSLNPEDRPTAIQVLQRLKEGEPVIEEPWPEHRICLDRSKLTSGGICGLKKVNASGEKKYELVSNEGKKSLVGKDDIISRGFARGMSPEAFAPSWPEHKIEFDVDKLKSRGFISSEQKVLAGIKGYEVFRSDSSSRFFKVEDLIMMRYAKKKAAPAAPATPVETGFAEPWDEHSIVFNADMIKAKGYIRSERKTLSGVKGYAFFRPDGREQFMRVEMVLLQKLARKV